MLDWLKGNKGGAVEKGQFSSLIKDYLKQAKAIREYWNIKPKDLDAGKAMIALEPGQHVQLVKALLKQYISEFGRIKTAIGFSYSSYDSAITQALQSLLSQLLRRKLPYQDEDLIALLKMANSAWKNFAWYRPHKSILGAIERHYKDSQIPQALIPHLKKVRSLSRGSMFDYAEDKELYDRVAIILGENKKETLKPDFAWSKEIKSELDALAPEIKAKWMALIQLAMTAKSPRPTKKWLAEAEEKVNAIGEAEVNHKLNRWFNLLMQEKFDQQPLQDNTNNTIMKGLVWITLLLPAEQVAREIKLLAIYCFRKIPDIGAVSTRVGNACLHVLGQLPGMDSVSMLNELMQKIKYPSARRLVEKALDESARHNNMSREDLEELSVPDFGMDSDGGWQQKLDNVIATVQVGRDLSVKLLWQKEEGKTQKTVPAHIKEDYADEIKEFKKITKDIQATLQSQGWRIERLFVQERQWSFAEWKQRYLDHHLLQHISHKLVWLLGEGDDAQSFMVLNGQLVNAKSEAIATPADSQSVRLWHPVCRSADEVMAWRQFLYEHEITQPFKQAHREVYIVTEAELETESYSNRFAAHVLKQHQLNALCQQRGWQYYLQGNFDSANSPTLELPQYNLSVEFWVDGIENSENQMGIFNYVSSDQVRFLVDGDLQKLVDIEKRVFSEVMRDVDLFVGVCSIGNDPGWQDNGLVPGYNEYWREFSFGELGANAEVRKEVLEKLLPRLKIADVCEIKARFLIVKGKLRTYKIHLGSANILMEPNDQYLCIVEGRSKNNAKTDNLFLPFEGDHRLAVILSKAFMLAEDNKIKDKLITSQINRK